MKMVFPYQNRYVLRNRDYGDWFLLWVWDWICLILFWEWIWILRNLRILLCEFTGKCMKDWFIFSLGFCFAESSGARMCVQQSEYQDMNLHPDAPGNDHISHLGKRKIMFKSALGRDMWVPSKLVPSPKPQSSTAKKQVEDGWSVFLDDFLHCTLHFLSNPVLV